MTPAQAPPCPICAKPVEDKTYRPFCSRRCADVDLQRWLSGRYVVPGGVDDADGPPTSGPRDED
jgi:endogenous inhibitor of DNA gyrase (YacG/DUF329 family)